MTRQFTDGAELGDLEFFDLTAGTLSAQVTNVRSGAYSYRMQSVGAYGCKYISALAEGYLRLGYFKTVTATQKFLVWKQNGTELGSLRFDSSNHVLIYTGAGTLVATSAGTVSNSTHYLIEARVKLDDASGVIDVWVNGAPYVSFSGDTKPGTDTTLNELYYGTPGGSGTALNGFYDDLALNDVSGTYDLSWCGDGKVVMLSPNAAGDVTQLAVTGSATNWQNVDELPPVFTDENHESVNDKYDLYSTSPQALPAGAAVARVWAEARATVDTADGSTAQVGLKTNGNEYWSSSLTLSPSGKKHKVGTEYRTNPNTGGVWTQSELDAVQVGFKVA